MIEKKNIGRLYGVCLATVFATLVAGIVDGFWHGLHISLLLLIFLPYGSGFISPEFGSPLNDQRNSKKSFQFAVKNSAGEKENFTIGLGAKNATDQNGRGLAPETKADSSRALGTSCL